ncbi:Nn.00g102660.m01.CDS01 [Neocucurbitaria sp. VM-36]
MEIKNPRRILAVGAPDSSILHLLKELTGCAPEPTSDTTAGLTHDWLLETKYYTATLPIWIDEIPDIAEWRTEFTKPEAREVVTVLGAWIYCFKKPVEREDADKINETMQAIADVIERACGTWGDMLCLAVAMPQSITPYLEKTGEEWENACMEYGFEYIDFDAKGKNEFGEAMGVQRVKEALETCDWESGGAPDFDENEEGFEGTFAAEEAEMNMELFGMKDALHGFGNDEEKEGEDLDVEELEVMMRKMVAIKEMGEGMEDAERKRFAAKAVNDLLKDL